MIPPIRIVFFGTPTFAVPFLTALLSDADFSVVGVVTQPDEPVGRKQIITPCAVKSFAITHQIPVFDFATLKSPTNVTAETGFKPVSTILGELDADVFVVVAYGKMIPANILHLAKYGCVNVHPSLLPRHRGPAPLQNALLSGDTQTGVSIMLLDEGMDTGPLLAQKTIDLARNETMSSLISKVHELGAPLLCNTLKNYINGSITPVAQPTEGATITHLLTRDDGRIDFSKTTHEIDCQFRAFEPWPGLWTMWISPTGEEKRLKIIECQPTTVPTSKTHLNAALPGMFFNENGHLVLKTRDGFLTIQALQLDGKPVTRIDGPTLKTFVGTQCK